MVSNAMVGANLKATLDGRDTGQNALTLDTCDADTLNKISSELGNTGQI